MEEKFTEALRNYFFLEIIISRLPRPSPSFTTPTLSQSCTLKIKFLTRKRRIAQYFVREFFQWGNDWPVISLAPHWTIPTLIPPKLTVTSHSRLLWKPVVVYRGTINMPLSVKSQIEGYNESLTCTILNAIHYFLVREVYMRSVTFSCQQVSWYLNGNLRDAATLYL